MVQSAASKVLNIEGIEVVYEYYCSVIDFYGDRGST